MNEKRAGGAVLQARGVFKTYREGSLCTDVLRGIDISVERAQSIAIVGSSGSGKSTLLHILGGLDKPDAGEVTVNGVSMASMSERLRGKARNQTIGFVYQSHHLLPDFSVLDNVIMPLLIRGERRQRAIDKGRVFLRRVGLGERARHRPSELSGGERQRCAVARAMITHPKCILADEPTGNLDERNAKHVFELMLELNREAGTSLVVATHNVELAGKLDRTLQMHDGRLVIAREQ